MIQVDTTKLKALIKSFREGSGFITDEGKKLLKSLKGVK